MAELKRQLYTFVPRSITHKQANRQANKKAKYKLQQRRSVTVNSNPTASSLTDGKGDSCSSSSDVKKYCQQQRWPSPDEPVCIMCKRYGEYICDETDEDVCSLECKALHLISHNNTRQSRADLPKRIQLSPSIAHKDEVKSTPLSSRHKFDLYYSRRVIYQPVKEITSINEEKMIVFRKKLEIRTKALGTYLPKLVFNFNQCSFPAVLTENLKVNGFVSPTPVQMQVIPAIISGNDVLVSACTSSGKTASFVLPVIRNIHNCLVDLSPSHDYCKYPMALIITPTRELALQIEGIVKLFCKSLMNFKTALLIGGVPLPPQLHRLKHKIQVIIGTPGRINNILENHHELLQPTHVKMVVLDEVDVMLQMGFQSQIQSIVEHLPGKPQYMMFSATIPPSIEGLAAKMMSNSIFVSVGSPGLPNKFVKQIVLWVEDASKKKKLFSIIEDSKHFLPPALVFVDSKLGADLLCEAISKKFVLHCETIHSDKSQTERSRIMQDFLSGAFDILVTTNVMGRGIDLVNVRQVILFDMPTSVEDYTHQVGRAGGLHSNGYVISFINSSNKKIFPGLKALFEATNNKLPDQVIHSPYLKMQNEKGESKRKQIIYKSEANDEITSQNLLQILTKGKKHMF